MVNKMLVVSEEAVMKQPNWVWITSIALAVCAIIIWGLFSEDYLKISAVLVIIMVASIIGVNMIGEHYATDTGRRRYKCIIDDSTSFNYIYDNYKIIDKEGIIYTLEEKEGDSNGNE